MASKTYRISFTTSSGTQNPVTFAIPDTEGTYKLQFKKSDNNTFYATGPSITVNDVSHRYNLKFSLSDGNTISAGYFTTPVASVAPEPEYIDQNVVTGFMVWSGDGIPYYTYEYDNVDNGFSSLVPPSQLFKQASALQTNSAYEVDFAYQLAAGGDQKEEQWYLVFSSVLKGNGLQILRDIINEDSHILVINKELTKSIDQADYSLADASFVISEDVFANELGELLSNQVGLDTSPEYRTIYVVDAEGSTLVSYYQKAAEKLTEYGYNLIENPWDTNNDFIYKYHMGDDMYRAIASDIAYKMQAEPDSNFLLFIDAECLFYIQQQMNELSLDFPNFTAIVLDAEEGNIPSHDINDLGGPIPAVIYTYPKTRFSILSDILRDVVNNAVELQDAIDRAIGQAENGSLFEFEPGAML